MIVHRVIGVEHWGHLVPAAPLAEAIHALAAKRFWEHTDAQKNGALLNVCSACRLADRTVREWRNGKRYACNLTVADRTLIGIDQLWWEVYDPERFPFLYSPVHWIDVVDLAARAFEGTSVVGPDTEDERLELLDAA